MPTERVAILPSHMRLGFNPSQIPLSDLIWPLGTPDNISGQTLNDLQDTDHLIVFPRKTVHWRFGFGTRAKVSLAICEPEALHGFHMRAVQRSHKRFYRVLSCNEELLSKIPNGIFYPYGTTWVPGWRELDFTKTQMCSLIASSKRDLEGQAMRHQIADFARAQALDIDVIGGGYKPFAAKSDGLASYRYSVVIENVRERNYFTEKLIDAILCQTVPIYWGCPNISDFMDTDAMVLCETVQDIEAALVQMSAADYKRRLPALNALEPAASDYARFYDRMAEALL